MIEKIKKKLKELDESFEKVYVIVEDWVSKNIIDNFLNFLKKNIVEKIKNWVNDVEKVYFFFFKLVEKVLIFHHIDIDNDYINIIYALFKVIYLMFVNLIFLLFIQLFALMLLYIHNISHLPGIKVLVFNIIFLLLVLRILKICKQKMIYFVLDSEREQLNITILLRILGVVFFFLILLSIFNFILFYTYL